MLLVPGNVVISHHDPSKSCIPVLCDCGPHCVFPCTHEVLKKQVIVLGMS